MKTIKTLASVAVLTMAAAGAHATTMSVSNFAEIGALPGATATGTGSGDLTGGVLTYDLVTVTDLGAYGTATVTSTGTWTNGAPGVSTGSIISCTGADIACDQVALGPTDAGVSTGILALSEVAETIFTSPPAGPLGESTWTVAPVPVPAAAWLFGSAILGLVGLGRRKAKA